LDQEDDDDAERDRDHVRESVELRQGPDNFAVLNDVGRGQRHNAELVRAGSFDTSWRVRRDLGPSFGLAVGSLQREVFWRVARRRDDDGEVGERYVVAVSFVVVSFVVVGVVVTFVVVVGVVVVRVVVEGAGAAYGAALGVGLALGAQLCLVDFLVHQFDDDLSRASLNIVLMRAGSISPQSWRDLETIRWSVGRSSMTVPSSRWTRPCASQHWMSIRGVAPSR